MVWWLWANSMYAAPQEAQPEQALQAMSEYGAQACCVWNREDGFHHFSANWARIVSLPPEECMGAAWLDFFHPEARTEFDAAIGDLFSPDPFDYTESVRMEAQIMRGDGSWGWLHLTLVQLSVTSGSRNISVLATDVTEQHQAKSQAESAQRERAVAQYSRSAFLSNMSHELRTPLNAVLGFAQLLEMAPEDGDRQDYVRYIRESGETLLHKISDLIEIAQIDACRARMQEEPLNLREVIGAAVETHAHAAFQRDVTIRCAFDRPNIVIQADRRKLEHALHNLLQHAIEHAAPEEAVMIRVSADLRDGLRIIVSDAGPGLPQDHFSELREALERADPTFNTDIGAVGIRLAIARELIALHHGRMAVHNAPGQGTIAVMHLPPGRIISLSARVKPKRQGMRQAV